MRQWTRRIRGALGLGLVWAVSGAALGFVIELITEFVPGWNGAVVDIWVAALAIPGFVGGVLFSLLLGIVARNRRIEELSIPRFAFLGAVSGMVLSLVPAAMVGAGLATANQPIWEITAVLALPFTLGSAAAAAATLAVARKAEEGPREMADAHRFDQLGGPDPPMSPERPTGQPESFRSGS